MKVSFVGLIYFNIFDCIYKFYNTNNFLYILRVTYKI